MTDQAKAYIETLKRQRGQLPPEPKPPMPDDAARAIVGFVNETIATQLAAAQEALRSQSVDRIGLYLGPPW